jgi:hypothetical protein
MSAHQCITVNNKKVYSLTDPILYDSFCMKYNNTMSSSIITVKRDIVINNIVGRLRIWLHHRQLPLHKIKSKKIPLN